MGTERRRKDSERHALGNFSLACLRGSAVGLPQEASLKGWNLAGISAGDRGPLPTKPYRRCTESGLSFLSRGSCRAKNTAHSLSCKPSSILFLPSVSASHSTP